MTPEAKSIWAGLEFRKPMMLRNVEPLNEDHLHWEPGPGRVSMAWQLWHIAEVEDNWVRDLVLGETHRFPFYGVPVRAATSRDQYPTKSQLISYFEEVRSLSHKRLESTSSHDFDREVVDEDYGTITVRDVWAGVVTSFAWHAGQIALTAKLLPDTPVKVMPFQYWKQEPGVGANSLSSEGLSMDILDRLLAHNEWAARVLLNKCTGLSAEDYNLEFEIGLGTLHKTLAHIIMVMNTWANIVSTDSPGERRDLSKACSTPGELLSELKAAHALLEKALKTVRDENRLDEMIEYVHPGTKMRYRFTRGSISSHVLTHGMHHRAQVLNMFRHLGVDDLPDGDVLEWEIEESVGSREPAE